MSQIYLVSHVCFRFYLNKRCNTRFGWRKKLKLKLNPAPQRHTAVKRNITRLISHLHASCKCTQSIRNNVGRASAAAADITYNNRDIIVTHTYNNALQYIKANYIYYALCAIMRRDFSLLRFVYKTRSQANLLLPLSSHRPYYIAVLAHYRGYPSSLCRKQSVMLVPKWCF